MENLAIYVKKLNDYEIFKLIPELKCYKDIRNEDGITLWEHVDKIVKTINIEHSRCYSATLYIATLFHEIGKTKSVSNYEEIGAEMCKTILHRLGLDSFIIDKVVYLVKNHRKLLDFNDCSEVENIRKLRKLMFYAEDYYNFKDLVYLTEAIEVANVSRISGLLLSSKIWLVVSDLGEMGYLYKQCLPIITVREEHSDLSDEEFNSLLEEVVKYIINNDMKTEEIENLFGNITIE